MRKYFWLGFFSPLVVLSGLLLTLAFRSFLLFYGFVALLLIVAGWFLHGALLEHGGQPLEYFIKLPGVVNFAHGIALGVFGVVLLCFVLPILAMHLGWIDLIPADL